MSETTTAPQYADLARRLRSFLAPHIHISAAHKDALAEAANLIEAVIQEGADIASGRSSWKLVPVNPTPEMVMAAYQCAYPIVGDIWSVMLDASPLPTGSEDKDVG